MTVGTGPVWGTQAAISVNLIHAGGTEGARRRLTLVNICHVGGGEKSKKQSFLLEERPRPDGREILS